MIGIGSILSSRYKIYDKVGGGGMAIVYIARDLSTNEVLAVKVLRPEYSEDPDYVARFTREAQTAMTLAHQNIANVRDFGEDQGVYFIVMEYVEGKTVAEIVKQRGPLPVDEVASIGIQAASALQFALEHGIIAHRDIKSQNLMITKDGKIKVMDFGIARSSSFATMTSSGMLVGTPNYISPEQAAGQRADIRSDVYSLGITLYEALTGFVPFDADTPWTIINMQINSPPPPVENYRIDIPKDFCDIIYKMIAKNPALRYQTPKEVEEALRPFTSSKLKTIQTEIPQEIPPYQFGLGSINLTSQVKGAKIYIDGDLRGEIPIIIHGISPGYHEIKVEKQSFKEFKTNILIKPDQEAILNVKLFPQPAKEVIKTPAPKEIPPSPYVSSDKTRLVDTKEKTLIEGMPSPKAQYEGAAGEPVQAPYVERAREEKKLSLLPVIIILSLLLVAGGVFGITRYIKNKGSEAGGGIVIAKYGTIDISSNPAGAKIYLDGKDTGFITPSKLSNVLRGDHSVKITLQGFKPHEEKVIISESQTVSISAVLVKESAPVEVKGSLVINSNPQGASILLNGKDTGKYTPSTFDNLEKGTHSITLKLNGYKDYSASIELKEGEKKEISASLAKKEEPQTKVATLSVDSNPRGASIFINNVPSGKKTLFTFIDLKEGNYEIMLKLEGYEDYKISVSLKAGDNKSIQANLKKKETPVQKGSLMISSEPKGAKVFIDRKDTGKLTPTTIGDLVFGKHTVKLTLSGYMDYVTDFVIDSTTPKTLTITLSKKETQNFKTYTSSKYKFSIKYPLDWQREENPDPDTIVAFYGAEQKDGNAPVLYIYTASATISPEEYYSVLEQEIKINYSDYKVVDKVKLTINNIAMYRVTASVTLLSSDGTKAWPSKITFWIFKKGETIFIIEASASNVNFLKFAEILKAMVDSFKFTP